MRGSCGDRGMSGNVTVLFHSCSVICISVVQKCIGKNDRAVKTFSFSPIAPPGDIGDNGDPGPQGPCGSCGPHGPPGNNGLTGLSGKIYQALNEQIHTFVIAHLFKSILMHFLLFRNGWAPRSVWKTWPRRPSGASR